MKAARAALAVLLLLLALPFGACRSAAEAEPSFEDSMVWVVEPGGSPEDALAYGVVIRDGFQVLTVLDYEDYTASGSIGGQPVYDLEVISPKYGRFSAAVAAVDPRTSATLLYLKSETPGTYVHLPTAEIADPASISDGQAVLVQGWTGHDNVFAAAKATVSPGDNLVLMFNIFEPVPQPDGGLFVGAPGAVVTTQDNAVLGLLGNWGTEKLVIRLGYPGMLPLAVSIGEAKELKAIL
jgi:hypothetical protein